MSMPPKNWFRLKAYLESIETRGGIAKDLAAAMGWSSAVLIGACRPGMESGELVKEHEGRAVRYTLLDPNAEPEPIRWTWWDDGDLIVYGLVENEDGSHTLPAEVVEAIRKRVAGEVAASNDSARRAA